MGAFGSGLLFQGETELLSISSGSQSLKYIYSVLIHTPSALCMTPLELPSCLNPSPGIRFLHYVPFLESAGCEVLPWTEPEQTQLTASFPSVSKLTATENSAEIGTFSH